MKKTAKFPRRTKASKSAKISKLVSAFTEPDITFSSELFDPAQLESFQNLKIAIVCDWLTGTGGAERVVLELHRLFPEAPIYTSQYDRNPDTWYGETWFSDAEVRTPWLQRLPKKLKKFLPVLRAYCFSRLDLSEYDLVIISSGAEAKAVKTGSKTKTILYCHAPTHYYWSRYNDYMKHPGFGAFNPLARIGLFALVRPLRKWDYKAAQKPDFIVANSTHTQSEIKKYYDRESVVVYPPVDTARFQSADTPQATSEPQAAAGIQPPADRYGFVVAGRQTPYKRIDLAVEACSNLNLPLTVIGNGPEHNNLTASAGQSVRFLPKVRDVDMPYHFQRAAGFIFPGTDDFGIVAVEAMSAGTPIIAYKAGGALDYVKPGVTGEFFEHQSVDSLMSALKTYKPKNYDNLIVKAEADRYNIEQFKIHIIKVIMDFTDTEN